MDDPTEGTGSAPDLGEPTDAAIGDRTAALLIRGDAREVQERSRELTEQEPTIDTPDELGGTGGEQAGGAG